jgi:hypothetical protein
MSLIKKFNLKGHLRGRDLRSRLALAPISPERLAFPQSTTPLQQGCADVVQTPTGASDSEASGSICEE